jgi:hypothetical protein
VKVGSLQKTLNGKSQNYVLTHRDDREAFYAYVDKLHAEGNWIDMPPLESEQDLENYPEFTKRFRDSSQA